MYRLYCRIFQFCFKIGMHLLPWREPKLLGNVEQLAELYTQRDISDVLLVTDRGLVERGLAEHLLSALSNADIKCTIYDKTVPNPTIANIEDAYEMYSINHCESIIALGGGSPMDCAKGVGARVARPNKTIPQLRGQLKIHKKLPMLVAIPTTAGTGSETTVAAVITNSDTKEKYAINDPSLIPHYAILDPVLTVKLPPHITSTTGMDALVHAIEAYIGNSSTKKTRAASLKATKLIFENLFTAYSDGENIEARRNMQTAAFLAGGAFTRSYVGNVHAVAHTFGGQYSTPHGLANAVILPYVLDRYGKQIYGKLALLAQAAGISQASTDELTAEIFIDAIRSLNSSMGIPTKLSDLKQEDIPAMIPRALKEANPLYPVPVIFDYNDMEQIYLKVLERSK